MVIGLYTHERDRPVLSTGRSSQVATPELAATSKVPELLLPQLSWGGRGVNKITGNSTLATRLFHYDG